MMLNKTILQRIEASQDTEAKKIGVLKDLLELADNRRSVRRIIHMGVFRRPSCHHSEEYLRISLL